MNTSISQTNVCKHGGLPPLALEDIPLYMYWFRLSSVPPLLFGLPGNMLIILIGRRKHNKVLSPSVYMTSMAVADTILLVGTFLFQCFFYRTGYVTDLRDLISRIALTIIITCGMLSGYYLSAMSVDRLIAVRFPMVAPSLCTPGRAKKVVIIGTLFVIAANGNLLYTLRYVKHQPSGLENFVFDVPGDPTSVMVATAFQLVFGTIIPFLIIITTNILIILTVKSASRTRAKLQRTTAEKTDKERQETQYLTRMLIFVSMAYVITSIPYRLIVVILLIPQVAASFDISDTCYFILYNLLIDAFYAVWIWNYAINFYMYCLGGGKRYRKDLADVMGDLRKCCC